MEKEVLSGDVVMNEETIENEKVVLLHAPYNFEGKEYKSIDLSGLENLTTADMISANKIMDRGGSTSFMSEMTMEYACIMASKATKLPVEFFYGLHPKDAIKLKNRMIGFFYGQD